MPNTIEIMVRSESGSIGENLGTNFSISSNVGAVVPNTATKNELISGKILTVDELASTIILTSLSGTCANTLSINIDKEAVTCYSTSAYNYKAGNTRPLDEDGGILAFQSEELNSITFDTLLAFQEGEEFNISFLGKEFAVVVETIINEEDGSIIKIGTVTSAGLSSGQFDASFSILDSVEMQFAFFEEGVIYLIKGVQGSALTVEEYALTDLISPAH
jgi:hypothetical protein